jgi:hypothetical protein
MDPATDVAAIGATDLTWIATPRDAGGMCLPWGPVVPPAYRVQHGLSSGLIAVQFAFPPDVCLPDRHPLSFADKARSPTK